MARGNRGQGMARGLGEGHKMADQVKPKLQGALEDKKDENSTRFGVPVSSDDYERLGRAFDAVRQVERAAEREALTRRVY